MEFEDDNMSVASGSTGTYEVMGTIGHGSFGLVLKARKLETGELVAVKRIPIKRGHRNEIQVVREMFTLRKTNHQNIVKLLDVCFDSYTISFVMELAESNLKALIDDRHYPVNELIIQEYFHQILCAVAYLHSLCIMHRDLKPGNILISADGSLKITDFGQSCVYYEGDPARSYDNQVASRWYRAPELLFGSIHYSPKVDLWACGCILAELFNRAPLFPGKSDFEQIVLIMSLLGSPCEDNWKGWSGLPDSSKLLFNEVKPREDWDSMVPKATIKALSLLRQLLVYAPEVRLLAAEALGHEFFAEFTPPHTSFLPQVCPEFQNFPTVVEYNPSATVPQDICEFFDL